jgi:hypothetical protein
MHFVSVLTEQEQLSEILGYLRENMEASVQPVRAQAFAGFQDRLQELEDSQDFSGVIDYLLQLGPELVQLPTSHKHSPITIQRAVLLLLPLLKHLDEAADAKDARHRLVQQVSDLCDLVSQSQYPLPIKVHS